MSDLEEANARCMSSRPFAVSRDIFDTAIEPAPGLQLHVSIEKPRAAKEILEVGQDVADRIRKRELQRSQQEQEAAEDPVTDLPGKQPVRPQQLPG